MLQFFLISNYETVGPVLRDGLTALQVRTDDRLCRYRQADGALLANQLAQDLIAVVAVAGNLNVDQYAGVRLHKYQLRVLAGAFCEAGSAGEANSNFVQVLTQQPAADVDLVDGNVGNVLLGGVVLRMAAGTADAVRHQRSTQLTGVEDLLHLDVVRVKAAHEADREALAAVLGNCLLDLLAVLDGLSQRLLTEDMLLGLAGCQTRCLVGIRAGCNNDCVNLGIVYQLVYIGVAIRYAELLLKCLYLALGAGANRYNLCVRITLQTGGVHSAHHTDANDTETNLLHL